MSLFAPRIVIIDDNKELLSILTYFLKECGFDARGLSSITNIEQLVELKPSLVLLDLEMPALTGYEVLELMRKVPKLKHIPVIVITGLKYRNPEENLHLAQDILEKPFSLDVLLNRISILLHENKITAHS
ncbi:MAG: response regulator [Bacillota bacterium]